MKRLLTIISIQLLVMQLFSQTEIPAGDITTTTWTANGSPYNVSGDIRIPAGETLTINPGVTVNISDSISFTVIGILNAEGTSALPITFSDTSSVWYGIDIPSSNTSADSIIFDYCDITGSIECGIEANGFDKLRISNCNIYKNNATLRGGGIFLRKSDAVVSNNNIEQNQAKWGGGIYADSCSVSISHNVFSFNSASHSGGALTMRYTLSTIANNLIFKNDAYDNAGGIQSTYSNGVNYYINNTIVLNKAYSGAGVFANASNDIFANNAIWGNDGSQFGYNRTRAIPTLHHNAIEGGAGINTNGVHLSSENLDPDGPNFADTAASDFSLLPNSPLIGSGTPTGTDIGYTMPAPNGYLEVTGTPSNILSGITSPANVFVYPTNSVEFATIINEYYQLATATYNGTDVKADLVLSGDTLVYTAENITVNGSFIIDLTPISYNVSTTAGANGNISPSGTSTGNIESIVDYTITPDEGYTLNSLTLNGADIMDNAIQDGDTYVYTLNTITEDMTLLAEFSTISYTVISEVSGANGSITPSGTSTETIESSIDYTITPEEGYILNSLTLNGADVMNDAIQDGDTYTYTLAGITEDVTLLAEFAATSSSINRELEEQISVYPIPASDKLYISFENQDGSSSIQVIDLKGRVLIQEDNFQSNSIDVSTLSQGVYYLLISKNNTHRSVSFIKE